MDKILFQNQFLAVIERNGYSFSREVRCNGTIISILPFRTRGDKVEYLARLEVCPAHGPELEKCSITGGVEADISIEETALQELWEEAGYVVDADDLISLGQVRPSKSSDTTVHLFAIDVTKKTRSTPPGDGSHFESNATVEWMNYDQGIQISDPLFVIAIARLERMLSGGY